MKKEYSIQDFLEVKAAGSPSFSPDGSMVAYLSTITGTTQVHLMSSDGMGAEQLTDYPDSIDFAQFSPIENKIIFGKSVGGNEQTQFFILNLETREIADITKQPEARHDFGAWSRDGKKICFASTERNGKDFDVYVMDIDSLEKKCIFDGGGWCAATGFSPNGTYVIAAQQHSNFNNDAYLCNVASSEVEHITPHEGNVLHMDPRWLPDESAFLFTQDKDREFLGLARYTLADKSTEYLLTPEWDIDGLAIDNEAKRLAVIVNEDGYNKAKFYDPRTLKELSYSLPAGNITTTHFSQDGTKLALSIGDSRHATNVWVMEFENGECRQITHSPQAVPPEVMVEPELIRYESFDGLSVPAFVYRPKDISKDNKLPVIINIHGGPENQYQPGLASITQYFVYSGYIVVAPNVRGSSGYGKTYMALDDVEKRMDSVKDIVSLREHLKTVPEVDIEKIVLMGGSYGGFMVLAGLAFYPELWAAAIDIVGIGNFVTFLENTASYRRALREAEYGSLESDRELLERISPFNSVEKILAPLFVIHGANDPRVPLSEAEQVVAKLKELGREVELLVYEDEGHGLAKLKNRLDAYPKVVSFLDKVLNQSR
ncbi:MAG: pop [Parcubacteria group bacterium]|nr:pop [Parcubacteria group bacterium]